MALSIVKGCLLASFVKSFRLPPSPFKMSTFKFSSEGHELVLDKFCARQFNNEEYTGSQIWYPEDGFEMQVNQYFKAGDCKLVDGYAPLW